MQYRSIPRTGISVSVIGFGVWTVSAGWWGDYTDAEAVGLLRQAEDLGITLFDTADVYGLGRGEELLARAFPKGRRARLVLASKFGYDFSGAAQDRQDQREHPQRWDPAFVRHACERSLRRLATDYLDLWQLHNPRLDAIQRDDLFELLERLASEGKVRTWGAALGPAIGWEEEGVAAMRSRRPHSLQMIYNLLEQDPGRALYRVARETDTGVLVRVPHASGMLEGRYDENTTFAPTDHRAHRPPEWLAEGLQKVRLLEFLRRDGEMTLGQAALKFILKEPGTVSILPNSYNQEQLQEFAAAPEKPDLTEAEVQRVQDLYESNFSQAARRE